MAIGYTVGFMPHFWLLTQSFKCSVATKTIILYVRGSACCFLFVFLNFETSTSKAVVGKWEVGSGGASAVLIITLVQGSFSKYESKRHVFLITNPQQEMNLFTSTQCLSAHAGSLSKHHSWWPHVGRNMRVEGLKNGSPAKSTSKQKLRFTAHTLH